jgi:large subunit ribosomal protein L9
MKVILNDHIDHLGERGDVVTVKPGYARNYLLPKGLAYLDTPGNRMRFDEEQTRWEEMDLGRRAAAEKMAADMVGTELLFERRAGEKDVLFGSVNIVDIGRELADRGFEIDRRRILLGHPIKELGSFQVDVQVHHDIKVTIPIHVVRPGEQPAPPETVEEGVAGEGVAEPPADAAPVEETAEASVAVDEVGGADVAATNGPAAEEAPEVP